jgi:hypothetical protein
MSSKSSSKCFDFLPLCSTICLIDELKSPSN